MSGRSHQESTSFLGMMVLLFGGNRNYYRRLHNQLLIWKKPKRKMLCCHSCDSYIHSYISFFLITYSLLWFSFFFFWFLLFAFCLFYGLWIELIKKSPVEIWGASKINILFLINIKNLFCLYRWHVLLQKRLLTIGRH